MSRNSAAAAMKFTHDRGRKVTTDRVLAVLAEAGGPLTTEDVVDRLGRSSVSRWVTYRRLAKLEQQGRVDKEIVYGATSIGHAFWALPESTDPKGDTGDE